MALVWPIAISSLRSSPPYRHPSEFDTDIANQVADVERHGRPPQASTTLPGPQQAERLPLPGDDGVRFDDHERRGPLAPDPREPNPEKAVRPGEAWPVRARSRQDPNLMTQSEQFEVQGGA
jgi:hypothetical protein